MAARVLLVEDDPAILELGASALREGGYDATAIATADIAALLLEEGVQFDVLVTDVVVPGTFDGFALAAAARRLCPRIAVIYSTGFGAVARVRARGAVPGDVLEKPWKPSELVRSVDRIVRARCVERSEPVESEAAEGAAGPAADSPTG